MKIDAQGIDAMIKVANGDMRTALNTFQVESLVLNFIFSFSFFI